MPTETITLTYGNPNSTDIKLKFKSSSFQWKVTNVGSTGTFVDGTPWIVMGSTGSYLTDISPRSYGITTTHTAGDYPIVYVYVNGSAKNLHTTHSKYNSSTLALESSPIVFDGRIGTTSVTQAKIDAAYGTTGLNLNIGYTSGGTGAAINPVGLTFGDTIITADSFWIAPGDPIIGTYGIATPANNGGSIPNVPMYNSSNGQVGLRTPLKRLGVLNILQSAPSEPSFRPPAQWKDSSSRSNFIVPLSHARGVTSIAEVFGYTNTNFNKYFGLANGITSPNQFAGYSYDDVDALGSLLYHGGDGQKYESDRGYFTLSNNPETYLFSSLTYYGYAPIDVLLYTMTNTSLPVKVREEARNRYIQYGIDAFGSVIAGTGHIADGGHKTAVLLPPILITGWLIGTTYGNQMIDIYNTIKTNIAGFTGKTNEQIGDAFFAEHLRYVGVTGTTSAGFQLRQTWAPGASSPNGTYVVSATEVDSGFFYNNTGYMIPIGGGGLTYNPIYFGNKFAKLNVAGGNINGRGFNTTDFQTTRVNAWYNYIGSYVKVTHGPGSGNSIYRILDVGPLSIGGKPYAADYLILDRPWIHGVPGASSTVECYPFRNGSQSFDGSTADLGRHIYLVDPDSKYNSNFPTFGGISKSVTNSAYGLTNLEGIIWSCCFLKKLYETTGNANFINFPGFKYWTQNFLGYNRDISDNSLFGNTPREEYINHLGMFEPRPGSYYWRRTTIASDYIKQLIGFTGSTGYGTGEWTKLPGFSLNYNASGLARVINNFGLPGEADYDFSGRCDAQDLAWFLGKWGS